MAIPIGNAPEAVGVSEVWCSAKGAEFIRRVPSQFPNPPSSSLRLDCSYSYPNLQSQSLLFVDKTTCVGLESLLIIRIQMRPKSRMRSLSANDKFHLSILGGVTSLNAHCLFFNSQTLHPPEPSWPNDVERITREDYSPRPSRPCACSRYDPNPLPAPSAPPFRRTRTTG